MNIDRTFLARERTTGQFARFGVVGTIGFVVDAAVLYLCLWIGLGFFAGRLISYLTAATTTWALNRAFTFASAPSERRHRQWAKFVALNSVGGAINYGVYSLLIVLGEPFQTYPVIAVGAGSIAGMIVNFWLSRTLVFASLK